MRSTTTFWMHKPMANTTTVQVTARLSPIFWARFWLGKTLMFAGLRILGCGTVEFTREADE